MSIQKQIQIQKSKYVTKQKQKYLLLYLALLATAVAGRVAFQPLPNIEPMTSIALLAGILLGSRAGFIFGVNALLASAPFMFLGVGIWTPLQAVGMGIAGYLGGMIKGKITVKKTVFVGLLATLLYHVVLDTWYAIFALSPLSLLMGIPFTVTHMASTAGFSLGVPAAKEKIERLLK
ncbi:DUF6580 family putative transport protein [Candidatus Undinarchaeota archaeon]